VSIVGEGEEGVGGTVTEVDSSPGCWTLPRLPNTSRRCSKLAVGKIPEVNDSPDTMGLVGRDVGVGGDGEEYNPGEGINETVWE